MRDRQLGKEHVGQVRWKDLVGYSGIGLALLLAAAALGLRDLEAAAMTLGTVVGLGLLRFRRGLLGLLALALLSTNVALWMTPGALSNVTHGEGFWETALPSSLTVVAVTTLIAAVAALAGLRSRETGTRWVRVLTAAAAVVLIAALALSLVGVGSRTRAESGDIKLVTKQVKFSSTKLDVTAGPDGRVGVFVGNRDLFWHTFTIKELHVNLNVPVGAERRIEFEAAPGTYEFICRIPGHAPAGMKGTLTVR